MKKINITQGLNRDCTFDYNIEFPMVFNLSSILKFYTKNIDENISPVKIKQTILCIDIEGRNSGADYRLYYDNEQYAINIYNLLKKYLDEKETHVEMI